MSRYIDADALKEKIGNTAFLKLDDTEVVEQFIDTAPSIDIVFCKECKYADKCSRNVAMRDTYQMYEKIDFCSYGVRKTNTTAEEKPTPIRDYMVHGERESE